MRYILCFLLFFISITSAYAIPPVPFRVGGTLSVNGNLVTQSQSGYILEVTKLDGSAYVPAAEDSDGLNLFDWYFTDIPIYDSLDQPGGAFIGDTAVIHVYFNSEELIVTSPPAGEFQVGSSGDTQQLDIKAHNNNAPSRPQLVYPTEGQQCSRTTEQFIWNKSTDPNGDQVSYTLQVCEDSGFTTGCLSESNIASRNNYKFFYAGINSWMFLLGIVFSGVYCKKRKLALLVVLILIAAMFIVSCGSTSEESSSCEHPLVPDVNLQNEIAYELSGLKSGTTYYWKVVVTDENDSKVHSETRSFTTQ